MASGDRGALVRLTVEGRVPLNTNLSQLSIDGQPGLKVTAVEFLDEPLKEPTRPYAMVVDKEGFPWVLKPADGVRRKHWRSIGMTGIFPWDKLVEAAGPLTIVFEGVDDGPTE